MRTRALLAVAVAVAVLAGCGGSSTGPRDVGAAPTLPVEVTVTLPGHDRPPSTATTSPTTASTTPTTAGGGPGTTAGPVTPPPTAAPPVTAAPEVRDVTLWLVRGDAVVGVPRQVPAVEGIGAETVRALLAGPTPSEAAAGYATAIPPDTRLLGLAIDDGLATVDLSSEFESGGGSASVTLRLAQVVCTLDAFPTVDRVRFHLDGEEVEVFSGEGVVADGPVSCGDYQGTTTTAPPADAEDGFEVAHAVESFMAARQAGSGWASWITEDALGAYEGPSALPLTPVGGWSIERIDGAGPFRVTVAVDGRVEVLTVGSGLAADGTSRDFVVTAARPG
jgi:hypothetical protein